MGRIHRSGKEFPPSPDDDDADAVERNAVPKCVHVLIQEALAIRDRLEWSKEAVDSHEELNWIEGRIQYFSEYFIPKYLPHGWTYDPYTARSLVVNQTLIRNTPPITTVRKSRLLKTKNYDRCCHKFPRLDKNGNPPKIYETSITEKIQPSWDEFKKFDAEIPMLDYYDMYDEEQKTFIPCVHPFVKVISDFALNSFNKALDTRVKYKQDKLTDLEMMESYYYKLEPNYWFYVMIKAREDGKCGVYEVKCEIGYEDGLITLSKFDFIQFDDEGVMEIDGDDVEYETEDYMYNGLVRRKVTKTEVLRRGYDYRNQYGSDRIWMM